MFKPVLAEVLKEPQNPLLEENSSNCVFCPTFSSSKRSALFSTKRQGSFPPSKNVATSSTEPFHLNVLYK